MILERKRKSLHASNSINTKVRIAATVLTAALLPCLVLAQEQAAADKQAPNKTPVSYGLVVDNSGSLRLMLDRVVQLVSGIAGQNGPEDEVFLVTFVDTPKIVLRQEFTGDPDDIRDAAENMFIEGGQTAIVDAVRSSADYLRDNSRKEPGRSRVLILITDGDEGQSSSKLESVLAALKEEKIRVFAVAIAEGKPVLKLLDKLTKETGGKSFVPKNNAELVESVKLVSEVIRTP